MIEWPSIEEITAELESLKKCIPEIESEIVEWDSSGDEEEPSIEIRLQVLKDGQWFIHTGDAQFDDDHNGFWGANHLVKDSDCEDVAGELLEEAQDHAYIHGEIDL